jgi:hypothetical protein
MTRRKAIFTKKPLRARNEYGVSRSRCTKAAIHSLPADRVLWPKNPMVGSFPACCARATSGHAAAPPSTVMNARRLMIDAPRAPADVRQPARNECPANCVGSSRSRSACSFTMSDTL